MKRLLFLGLTGLLFMTMAVQAGAAGKESSFGYRGWGLRGGISVDPDQLFIGGQFDLGEFTPNLRFKPNATLGFGDDITLVSINPDISYAFPAEGIGVLYAGGLLALQWGTKDGESDTELGLHVITGLELEESPLFFELNVGLDDTPDVKIAAGYGLGR